MKAADGVHASGEGELLNISTRISIHSRRRTVFGVTLLCLGVLLIAFCLVVLPELIQGRSRGDSGSRSFAFALMPWLFGAQLILNLCRLYPAYLWSRAAGLLSERTRGWWWLDAIPWFCLYTIVFLLFWDFYQPVSSLWFILWIPPTVAVFFSIGAGRSEAHAAMKLQSALTPEFPAGTPGAEPWETGSVVRGLQIIVVRNIPDQRLLQLLATHLAVKSFRLIPDAGFAAVLCEVYPRLKSMLPFFVQTQLEETEFEEIDAVVNDWGWRSDWPWHGVLDDGTVLVHNEGETRIVPVDPERHDLYCAALKQHGAAAGLDGFYVQSGGETMVEKCLKPRSKECGTGVSPVY